MAHETQAQADPRKTGGRYYSGYWREAYVVLARQDRDGIAWFSVRWDDGSRTTHCTPWDANRDHVISEPASLTRA